MPKYNFYLILILIEVHLILQIELTEVTPDVMYSTDLVFIISPLNCQETSFSGNDFCNWS